ncbi:MAG: aminotransferase class III-fold pyridoxal phosphate-dependent enzyme [Pseudomonadota bacterium]|nr:aminotransferase class III-fold pyridoxal phosphate-dependent enzyme [Pseudomonadota bacterium]
MNTGRPVGFGLEELPCIVRGRGSWLFDAAGRRYLDGSGGPAAFSIGHGNVEVNTAIAAQLAEIACAYRYLFTSEALTRLTAMILTACGGDFGHIVFTSSGSEAMESALKLALQYCTARGAATRKHFIARQRSYHGNTLGALSVSGFPERRGPFEGSLLDVSFVSAANEYRPLRGVSPAELVPHLAAELEARILAVGPERVAAFVFEPVVGAAGGVVPAPPGYARAMREICDRYEILLIADEVMCGAGRCGTWCALAHDGIQADIMAVAKGLAGGYLPLAATIFSRRVGETIIAKDGAFLTGHTFSGHTAACAAAVAVQSIIERDELVARVHDKGPVLKGLLEESLRHFAAVGDIRGRGFLIGIEFVCDPHTKEPFPQERAFSHEVGRRAFEDGLICYPCGGHVDGRGDTVIIAPPYNATDDELGQIVEKFTGAVAAAVRA